MEKPRSKTYTLVSSKEVFRISLIVAALTILGVYFWGLGAHHTFFENSILSTTILSIAFCSFISTGLYRGVKLKDNLGKITDKIKSVGSPDFSMDVTNASFEAIEIGEGIADFIVSILVNILLWLLVAVVLSIAIWFFSNIMLLILLVFAAMLYWIFFRALRLVFKNSNKTKGDLIVSILMGVGYTVLYNFWIYGIFVLTQYLKH